MFQFQAILGILIPFNLFFSKLGEYLQTKQLKAKDERIKLMNEILSGMKVLKVYAWEIPFMKRLANIRKKEIRSGPLIQAVYIPIYLYVPTYQPTYVPIQIAVCCFHFCAFIYFRDFCNIDFIAPTQVSLIPQLNRIIHLAVVSLNSYETLYKVALSPNLPRYSKYIMLFKGLSS